MSRLVIVIALLVCRPALAEPSDTRLVLTGLAMAPPTYLIGVTVHESSHALMAEIVGADVDELHVFPPGIDPKAHVFRFGWTYVHGLTSDTDRALFYIAPKLTDSILLGGFAALAFTDAAWPGNKYGQLALTVLATGFWVDFAKDVVLFSKQNDVVRVFDLWCMTGWNQLPARLVYAGAVVGFGLVVARGYERTFDRRSSSPAPLIVPLLTTAF